MVIASCKSVLKSASVVSIAFTSLAANDVKAIDTTDADFNTDLHEAITTFAAGEEKKGKVIDCTQKGYTLGEKVIRFSKVVVGE